MRRVLVVDDEENIRLVLETLLERQGFQVQTAADAEQALAGLERFDPDFVIADVRMPGMSGISLCEQIKARGSAATVIVTSAYGSVDLALEALQAGAYDYVAKPFEKDAIVLALRKAEERESLRRENEALRAELRAQHRVGEMLGRSAAMQEVFRILEKVAQYDTSVLLQGPSGTGKELVARALHARGTRKTGPFVAVNCGAIPENLIESELFGHVRGAFTDAREDRAGLFEQAQDGTLLLDEVGELPLQMQVKLLRCLQEQTVRRLGENKDRKLNVRLVAATVRDLNVEVQAGRFREDLFYRLNVLQIQLPPLRDREGDLDLLVGHFLERTNQRLGTRVQDVEPAAMRMLMRYGWPGNVRELENVLERAVVLAESSSLTTADLPDRVRLASDPVSRSLASGELSIKRTARIIEETLIRRALDRTHGNRSAAARLLEISHRALLYKIKNYGVG